MRAPRLTNERMEAVGTKKERSSDPKREREREPLRQDANRAEPMRRRKGDAAERAGGKSVFPHSWKNRCTRHTYKL